MTIAPENTSELRLSANDRVVGDGDHEPTPIDFMLPWVIGVSLHIRPETPIGVRVYESEERAVIRFGSYCADLDLYANVDQLDRLITLLTTARKRLL